MAIQINICFPDGTDGNDNCESLTNKLNSLVPSWADDLNTQLPNRGFTSPTFAKKQSCDD